MKKFILLQTILLFVVFFSFMTSGCINGIICEKGNGKIIKQERKVTSFNSLEISGGYTIYLKQDSSQSVFVEADDNLLSLITTKVEGNKLIIDNKKDICGSKTLNIYISTPDIKGIDISGAVDIKSTGKFKTKELDIDISGMGDINMDISVTNLSLSCSGSGKIYLSGDAENVDANLSGAGDINAFDFITKKFKLSNSGAGTANLNVTDNLDVEISGAASVKYKGNPKVYESISGVGTIKKAD